MTDIDSHPKSLSTTRALLAGASALALTAIGVAALVPTSAEAASCGLSLADNDSTINTVGGANSTGQGTRVACGVGAQATGAFATAVGGTTGGVGVLAATESAAFGSAASAAGSHSTAIGRAAGLNSGDASGYTVLGALAGRDHLLGAFSITIGGANSNTTNPRATGSYSIAIGGGDGAAFLKRTLIGARANSSMSIAIGTSSLADSDFAIALGSEAKASKKDAVALGRRSVANVANTVSVGRAGAERRIMNVAPAVLNTDAVNLAQVKTLVASALAQAQAQGTAQAVSVAPAESQPAIRNADDAMRRELAELRALVRQQQAILEQQQTLMDQQQQRIVRLEGRSAAAR